MLQEACPDGAGSSIHRKRLSKTDIIAATVTPYQCEATALLAALAASPAVTTMRNTQQCSREWKMRMRKDHHLHRPFTGQDWFKLASS
jgi:hypothetical protein